jgi:hypothetical protein
VSKENQSAATGFQWGQPVVIEGKSYWLNRCGGHGDCPSGSLTYHIIAGEPPEPEEDEDEQSSAALPAP